MNGKKQSGRPPVVLHFQTNSYVVLQSPDELREWERLMRDEVGFKADISNVSGTCTESSSAGNSDDCDQD